MADVALVVGLGNPGEAYARTRHNVGFWVADALVETWAMGRARGISGAQLWRGRASGREVLVVRPETYMNDSGGPVGHIARFYKVPPAAVLVVHDELDFAAGLVRFKGGGGHGGHNGLRSLSRHIGPDYARLRVGIGRPPAAMDAADYVLAAPRGEARVALEAAATRAAEAAAWWLAEGLDAATRRLHGPPR